MLQQTRVDQDNNMYWNIPSQQGPQIEVVYVLLAIERW